MMPEPNLEIRCIQRGCFGHTLMFFLPQASPQRTHEKPSVKLLQVQDIAHMNTQISWHCGEMLVETSNSSNMGKKV